mmetsp:Transcript_17994/g.68205  ORF Transcript_17994/g.68205 Transcript_17994/m.68205 type:complete len:202 (+) Transcript_17994:1968-2573(+)
MARLSSMRPAAMRALSKICSATSCATSAFSSLSFIKPTMISCLELSSNRCGGRGMAFPDRCWSTRRIICLNAPDSWSVVTMAGDDCSRSVALTSLTFPCKAVVLNQSQICSISSLLSPPPGSSLPSFSASPSSFSEAASSVSSRSRLAASAVTSFRELYWLRLVSTTSSMLLYRKRTSRSLLRKASKYGDCSARSRVGAKR